MARAVAQQTILVTGATDGMGRALAARLTALGATVLVHGRSRERGEATVAALSEATGSDRVHLHLADFASLAQVRSLVDDVRSSYGRLDVLVNNAGLGSGPAGEDRRELSDDGHELRFQVAYLASFTLTAGLFDLLAASGGGRVVNVASVGQQALDLDDLMLEHGYSGNRAYRQSKLAVIMHAFELARREAGSGVTANALHPASLMNTKMVYESFGYTLSTVEDGVRNTLRLAIDPALAGVSGRYFNEDREDRADDQAYDADARARLWAVGEELTRMTIPAT